MQVSVECSLEYTCINRHPGVTTGISYLHLPLLGRHVNHVFPSPPTIHKSTYNKVHQLIYYDYQKLRPIYLQQNSLTSANVLTMLWTYRRVKKFTQNWTYKNVMRHIYVYLFFLDIRANFNAVKINTGTYIHVPSTVVHLEEFCCMLCCTNDQNAFHKWMKFWKRLIFYIIFNN